MRRRREAGDVIRVERQREIGLAADEEGARARIEELFDRVEVSIGDRKALERKLARRPRYVELESDLARRDETIARGSDGLRGREALLDLSVDELEARIAEQPARTQEIESIDLEIGATKEAVKLARRGNALEDLLAKVDAAREDLDRQREEKLRKTAGSMLLASVRQEYDRSSRPTVLRKAEELFELFTRRAYELRLDPGGDDPTMRGLETETGKGKALSELSQGTRIQLLLAARLAFALQLDPRGRVPLLSTRCSPRPTRSASMPSLTACSS